MQNKQKKKKRKGRKDYTDYRKCTTILTWVMQVIYNA